jgi:pilus assembly protein Flp/PilA
MDTGPNERQSDCEGARMNALLRFYREEEGVTAIEYGLIASLVAVAIIVALQALATALNTTFNDIACHL